MMIAHVDHIRMKVRFCIFRLTGELVLKPLIVPLIKREKAKVRLNE